MRLTTVLLLVILVIGIESCGGSGSQENNGTDGTPPTEGATPPEQNPPTDENPAQPDTSGDSESPTGDADPEQPSTPVVPHNPIGNDTLTGLLDTSRELSWGADESLSAAAYAEQVQQRKTQGHMLIDIDAYADGTGTRYNAVWRENVHSRNWEESHGITQSAFLQMNDSHTENGLRPVDLEVVTNGNQQSWAGVWIDNEENLQWMLHHSIPGTDIDAHLQQNREAGFRLVDIEIQSSTPAAVYATLWYQNPSELIWEYESGLTSDQLSQQVETRKAMGLQVVDIELYAAADEPLYAALWQELNDFAWQVATDRTRAQFSNLRYQYKDEGYRLIDIERHGSAVDPRFSGVWAENSPRLRDNQVADIDSIVSAYAQANNLPGISVAVIRADNMIYRKGMGLADIESGKLAHGETVYNVASVAKAIGGTLAAKLESEEMLSDGSTFNLDLSQATSSYLQNLPGIDGADTVSLPDHHKHSVEELLAHLGCVAHYSTQPAIANLTSHFPSASDAVQSIWNTLLVTETTSGQPCTPSMTYSYSTGAFTFVGAALETVTGRNISQLLAQELAEPFNLSSIRAQFGASSLSANSERATPYDSANQASYYADNSWKVLGGGIEASAVDLARFGWYVLDGKIVDPSTRDNRLWAKVNAQHSNFGLGWLVSSSRAEMNGSWTGARSILRIYRNDGIVIAVTSNRNNHTVDDVGCLADKIRNSLFNINEAC